MSTSNHEYGAFYSPSPRMSFKNRLVHKNKTGSDLNLNRSHSGLPGSNPLTGDGYTNGLGNQFLN
eukprot:CAMPEP_0198219606 /NCGR_PEP_ID=MMETSP1445-20131203/75200_1 /TAXON_ID=36898 /ORGANISM="Pyramimonas sp., Strain CCMP2087" /LENGTH=64 /DNA_ID=CAMNT_0043897059 /DNA_START=300 /DNA_END=491 /DNA_ORIENTATION=+